MTPSIIPWVKLSLVRSVPESSLKNPPDAPILPWSAKAWKQEVRSAQWSGALEVCLIIPLASELPESFVLHLRYLGYRSYVQYISRCVEQVWNLGGQPLFPVLEANPLTLPPTDFLRKSSPVYQWRWDTQLPDEQQFRAIESLTADGHLVIASLGPDATENQALQAYEQLNQLAFKHPNLMKVTVPIATLDGVMPQIAEGDLPVEWDFTTMDAEDLRTRLTDHQYLGTQIGRVNSSAWHRLGLDWDCRGPIPLADVRAYSMPAAAQCKRLAQWLRDRSAVRPSPKF